MGRDGIRQIGEEIPLLLLACGGDGEHALDKVALSGTLGTVRAFAPQDGRAQGALSGVVGRLHARARDKQPPGILPLEQVVTEARKAVAPVGARPQLVADRLLDGAHGDLEAVAIVKADLKLALAAIQRVGTIAPPRRQRGIGLSVQGAGRVLSRPPIGFTPPQVADEISPTQLAVVQRQPVVDLIAVAAQGADVGFGHQSAQHLPAPPAVDGEQGHGGHHHHPQPDPFGTLTPVGLINVQMVSRLHRRFDLSQGGRQGRADGTLERGDTPRAQDDPKDRRQQGHGFTVAEPIATVQQGHQRGQPRPEGTGRRRGRRGTTRVSATVRTGDQRILVCGHGGPDRRDLGELLAYGGADRREIRGQGSGTAATGCGVHHDQLIDLVGGAADARGGNGPAARLSVWPCPVGSSRAAAARTGDQTKGAWRNCLNVTRPALLASRSGRSIGRG